MNVQYLGNSPSLTNTDLLVYLSKFVNLPVWYISMLTEPRNRNRADRNGINYRIGSANESLKDFMKSIYYSEHSTPLDFFHKLSEFIPDIKIVTNRNNSRAGHFRMGYVNYFNDRERSTYFNCFCDQLNGRPHLLFIDPDIGIAVGENKKGSAGASYILPSELVRVFDSTQRGSVIIVKQRLLDYSYSHERRINDLQTLLDSPVLFVIDEIIQSGLFFLTKDKEKSDEINSRLQYYLNDYRFLKKSSRIFLGYHSREHLSITSIGSFNSFSP